jgi:structural maintenance of chromosome 4
MQRQSLQRFRQASARTYDSLSLTDKEFTVKECSQELNTIVEEQASLKGSLDKIRTKIPKTRQAMQESSSRLAESKATVQSASSRVNIVKSLLSEQRKGHLNGVHGRLGDLGIIGKDYDAAVTTALGGSLDHIVVDTVAQGQACIAHLKRTGMGRTTFICLDKLPKYKTAKINTPEDSARLFDLIEVREEIFANAFYHVARDTLVGSDLAQAKKIAFGGGKRWRVVTLDGQVIDASGTMSGGGSRVARGGMAASFANHKAAKGGDGDAAGIALLEQECLDFDRVIVDLKEQLAAMERRGEEIARLVPAARLALDKAKLDLGYVVGDIKQTEGEIDELVRGGDTVDQADIDRMGQLKAQILKDKASLEKKRESCAGIEQEIADLQEEIMKVGGIRLRTQKAVHDGIAEQIDTCNQGLTRLMVEKSTREKSLVKLEAALEKKNVDLEESNQELETLIIDLSKQREAVVDVRERVQEAKNILEEKETELEGITKELEEKTAVIDKIRDSEQNLSLKQTQGKKKLAEIKSSLAVYEKQLGSLKLNEFEYALMLIKVAVMMKKRMRKWMMFWSCSTTINVRKSMQLSFRTRLMS